MWKTALLVLLLEAVTVTAVFQKQVCDLPPPSKGKSSHFLLLLPDSVQQAATSEFIARTHTLPLTNTLDTTSDHTHTEIHTWDGKSRLIPCSALMQLLYLSSVSTTKTDNGCLALSLSPFFFGHAFPLALGVLSCCCFICCLLSFPVLPSFNMLQQTPSGRDVILSLCFLFLFVCCF